MAWKYIDPLLENATRHSTIFGKYWIITIVIFRFAIDYTRFDYISIKDNNASICRQSLVRRTERIPL